MTRTRFAASAERPQETREKGDPSREARRKVKLGASTPSAGVLGPYEKNPRTKSLITRGGDGESEELQTIVETTRRERPHQKGILGQLKTTRAHLGRKEGAYRWAKWYRRTLTYY